MLAVCDTLVSSLSPHVFCLTHPPVYDSKLPAYSYILPSLYRTSQESGLRFSGLIHSVDFCQAPTSQCYSQCWDVAVKHTEIRSLPLGLYPSEEPIPLGFLLLGRVTGWMEAFASLRGQMACNELGCWESISS